MEKKSHMNDGEMFIEWLETVVRDSFRLRPKDCGLSHEVKGMLIVDPGSSHICWTGGQKERRDAICKELNIRLEFLEPGFVAAKSFVC